MSNNTRLTPDKWLAAGFQALQALGPQALAAEPLARQLGTTKGSFYWHFRDVPAFQAALLTAWRTTALQELHRLLSADGPPDQRLRDFGHALLADQTETSLRMWAQTNSEVANVVQETDAERLAYMTELLRQIGLSNADFARALLACLVGLPQISAGQDNTTQRAAFDTLVDTVLALS